MRSLVVAAALLVPAAALANGRPPITNGVHFRPGDNHALYVSSTFGLLISHDDGCSFRWVCEKNIGYGGTFDPKYRIAADGTIFATTYSGLRVSRDGGCTFTTATAELPAGDPGRLAETWVDALDIGPTGEIWIATADGGKPNNVYRSTDNGLTFAPRGMLSQAIWWKSIAVAPARAQRVYATGYQVAPMPPTAHFEITDDGGDHWAESPLAGVKFGMTPLMYVVGVDRTNPDIVYMSSFAANPPVGDRLYRSSDGGMTWTEVLATAAQILDLTAMPTGNLLVATSSGAAFESTDHGASFAAMSSAPQLACVGARDDGRVYGCAANWDPDEKAIAMTTDAQRWNKVFRFVELAGPLDCPEHTAEHDTCGDEWPAVKDQFGATGPTGTCAVPDSPDKPLPRKTGGCDAGDASVAQLGALGMFLVGWLAHGLRLRRRKSSAARPSRQLG
jgi:hypothetical protein